MTTVQVVHCLHEHIDLRYRGRLLFRYVYEPATALTESPKPFFHPICTLAGEEVTIFRPHDHVWHKGLAMTCAHLSGQNFWGGPTYVRGRGYVPLDNHGRIQHRRWEALHCEEGQVLLQERLHWITAEGERWIEEMREIAVPEIHPDEGYWELDLGFRLRNVSGHPLHFGSPTTAGRPRAGYGGLFWRGPRSFLHGTILAAHGLEGPEVMGEAAPWLAYIGRHDGTCRESTLLFLDHPGNPRYPNRWFVRNDPYACVSFAFMFDEEYQLPAGQELNLRYRIVIADGAWSRERLEAYARRWEGEGRRRQ